MFGKLFLNKKDLEAMQQRLAGNPLLASLLMISPADAFKYLNVMPRFFDARRPTTAEDIRLVEALIQALTEGRSALEQPQVVQPASDPALLKPAHLVEARAPLVPPDITLTVSKATLQHVLKLYAESSFTRQEFVLPAQGWFDVSAKGEAIALDLTQERARIVAKLRGILSFRLSLLRFELYTWRIAFPIEIDVLAALAVDQDDLLYLSVGEGEISIANAPLPSRLANDLVERISGALPGIPIVRIPTRFEIPGEPAGELRLRLSHIGIDDSAVKLEFQLDD